MPKSKMTAVPGIGRPECGAGSPGIRNAAPWLGRRSAGGRRVGMLGQTLPPQRQDRAPGLLTPPT